MQENLYAYVICSERYEMKSLIPSEIAIVKGLLWYDYCKRYSYVKYILYCI